MILLKINERRCHLLGIKESVTDSISNYKNNVNVTSI